jgi:hypothetical protein
MGQVSKKLKRRLQNAKTGRSREDAALRRLRQQVKKPPADVKTRDQLRDYHPLHAAYLAGQNLVSFLAEELSLLPELAEYYDVVSEMEEGYMPDGPPFSPLTHSYFSSWAFFDAYFGRDRETIGTCLLDLGPDLGISADDLEVIGRLQQSRMGIYEHQGVKGELVQLQELVSAQAYTCRVPAGYLGHKGELWFVRILPALPDLAGESLVLTTPYVLVSPGQQQWLDFLNRSMPQTGQPLSQPILTEAGLVASYPALAALLKYGLSRNYWHEFIFLAYHNSQYDAIFLTGLPDVPESLPHASEF